MLNDFFRPKKVILVQKLAIVACKNTIFVKITRFQISMNVTMSSHVSMVARIWPEVTSALVQRAIDSMLIIEHAKTSMNVKSKTLNAEKV